MPRTKPEPVALRARLRSLIEADGRPVAAIAAAAGLNRQLVYQILNGYRPNPSVETIGRLLGALNARWADLD